MVADLIERKFGVRLGLTAVGELLAKLGLTPRKPLQRAYQRDPEAIEKWQRESFRASPATRRQLEARLMSGTSPDFVPMPRTGQDLGCERTNACRRTAGAKAIDQCGIGCESRRGVLGSHLPRRPHRRAIRRLAEETAAAPG